MSPAAEARATAGRAAEAAAVEIVAVRSPDDAARTVDVFSATWGEGRGADPSTLQAIAHAGNPVLLALRDGQVLGALFSFLGWDGGLHAHSHMTAVSPLTRSTGVGLALKAAQRAECLERGVREVRWTYDPLIRRNARFNLWKLGARVSTFQPDFYGVLDDAINGTDHSDRFEVTWRLDSPAVAEALTEALGARVADRTAVRDTAEADDLELPVDFEALRREDPRAAAALREASRARFAEAMATGAAVRFTGTGYVFDRANAAVVEEETR